MCFLKKSMIISAQFKIFRKLLACGRYEIAIESEMMWIVESIHAHLLA